MFLGEIKIIKKEVLGAKQKKAVCPQFIVKSRYLLRILAQIHYNTDNSNSNNYYHEDRNPAY
jgi:hypothetical protein